MAVPRDDGSFSPNLFLSSEQQDLLLTALSSNNPNATSNGAHSQSNSKSSMANAIRSNSNPLSLHLGGSGSFSNNIQGSPLQETPGPDSAARSGFDDSPFLDYDLDDGNFDWDTSADQLFGNLPGEHGSNEDGEHNDKRKNPDDEQDDEEGGGKRREGDDKQARKPGRKPLTSEPTSKRKAQNRAAQRAFRERKERHLKELETKVDDLEKASESANHENGRLRAQVDRLQTELKEYRKRLSMNGNGVGRSASYSNGPMSQSKADFDINSTNFSFEFPRFGGRTNSDPSDESVLARGKPTQRQERRSADSQNVPGVVRERPSAGQSSKSRQIQKEQMRLTTSDGGISQPNIFSPGTQSMEELSGLFSPSVLESASRQGSTDYLSYTKDKPNTSQTHQRRTESAGEGSHSDAHRTSSASTVVSPCPSSAWQSNLESSAGTTPESSVESPRDRKASEAPSMNINGDRVSQSKSEVSTMGFTPSSIDTQNLDWMVQQNGGSFDPVLFGDYRDPQENIMNGDFGDFFNEALPLPDFGSPITNLTDETKVAKTNVIQEVEDQQSGKEPEVDSGEPSQQFLSCNLLWDRVQKSDKIMSGETDMDDLCSQLKQKAKCSGSGAVIDTKDVDAILGPLPGMGPKPHVLKDFY